MSKLEIVREMLEPFEAYTPLHGLTKEQVEEIMIGITDGAFNVYRHEDPYTAKVRVSEVCVAVVTGLYGPDAVAMVNAYFGMIAQQRRLGMI